MAGTFEAQARHDDGAPRHHRRHHVRGGLRHRQDEFLLGSMQAQRRSITSGGEGQGTARRDAVGRSHPGMGGDRGRERCGQGRIVGAGQKLAQCSGGRISTDELPFVGLGVPHHDDGQIGGARRRGAARTASVPSS